MKNLSRFGSVVLLVLLSALGGVTLGNVLPVSARGQVVGHAVHLGSPTRTLEDAEASYPYEVKKPGYLPEAMGLHHVLKTTPVDEGESSYSVDLFYRDGRNNYVHVWQTDNKTLAAGDKDPSAPGEGEPTVINDRVWQFVHHSDLGANILSTKFNDGVTLSVDTNLGENILRRIAASIR